MDTFIRQKEKKDLKIPEDFQVLSWHAEDIYDSESETSFYKIFAFGSTDEGDSVCLQINGFTPFFYIKVPMMYGDLEIKRLSYCIEKRLGPNNIHFLGARIVMRKDIYGFTNNTEFKFVRLLFDNFRSYNTIIYFFKDHNKKVDKRIQEFKDIKFPLYNSNVNPLICFTTIKKILMAGYISLKETEENDEGISRCQINRQIDWKKIVGIEKNTVANFTTLSFDIECYSSNPKQMPTSSCPEDKIIQIGSCLHKHSSDGTDILWKHVVVLGPCDPVDGVTIVSVNSEKELIKEWVSLVKSTDPDQLIGYNIDDFDWKYIWDRAQLLQVNVGGLSRLIDIPSTFKDDTMESKAYGVNIFRYIQTPGVNQIDLLHWFRREIKMESYKLEAVSQKFLGVGKNDVTPQEIFKMAGPEGSANTRAKVAAYCAQDTTLPIRLMNTMAIVPNYIEMAKVTRVPIFWLVSRGQQIKVFSQIFYEAWYHNFLIPTEIPKENFTYQGAHVFEPMRGAYFKPISGLDFASLYPSIMIAHNLCPSTWVRSADFKNISGVEYEHIEWEDGNYIFVKKESCPGLVPTILQNLWSERKRVKKELKNAKGILKLVLNGKQLAIKVSMNSIYGFFGAATGMLPCVPIASSVTYIGRKMIEHSKKCAEEWYDGSEKSNGIKAIVRYGDSIPGYIPVMIRKNGVEDVVPIENLFTHGKEYLSLIGGLTVKEECRPDHVEAKIEKGYSKIIRIVRHKTPKKLYRIRTNNGSVTVTEDHSLVRDDGELVKPTEVTKDTRLLFYVD